MAMLPMLRFRKQPADKRLGKFGEGSCLLVGSKQARVMRTGVVVVSILFLRLGIPG